MSEKNTVNLQQEVELAGATLTHKEVKRVMVDTFRHMVERIDKEFEGIMSTDEDTNIRNLFTVQVGIMVDKWDVKIVMKAEKAD